MYYTIETLRSVVEELSKIEGFNAYDCLQYINNYANTLGKSIVFDGSDVSVGTYSDLESFKVKKQMRDNDIEAQFLAMVKAAPTESPTRISQIIGLRYGISDRAVQKILKAKGTWISRNSK